MRTAKTIAELHAARRNMDGSIGFVPTMGFLHDGHLALVRKAREDNDHVIASIFVNPTQFGPNEDFKSYPRDTDRDLQLLRDAGTDLTFLPSVDEIYPPGCSTWVNVEGITTVLEGASRPDHFRGVATVVTKLFNIVMPDRAYFGEKDAQQLLTIRKMVADLNMGIEIIAVPTVREHDGLAMSSRNTYLDPEERRSALVLWKSLQLAKEMWSGGEDDAEKIRSAMRELISAEPRASIDYISVADAASLEELQTVDRPALVSLAVRIGRTRLIDNLTLEHDESRSRRKR
jgi:pantoate--beta-alanine ligase